MFQAHQHHGVVPDGIMYNALVGACDQPDRGLQMFHYMQRQSVVPTVVAYNALIIACGKESWPDQAQELFNAMQL